MNIALHWLNTHLDPPDCTAQEADDLLTRAGFPIEETTHLETTGGGDTLLDVEVTSNRGDCLSHHGCAREVAAASGRALVFPAYHAPHREGPVADALTLENRDPDRCPHFTAQVVRGVKVGPSPDWLVNRLEAVGQRSINNVVDITNYLTLGLGHPCHVFDLAKLAGNALIIRPAIKDEPLTTLDGKARKLTADDLVVADAERAQSLAGVIGGKDSEVTDTTTDVVFEMATWAPVAVRDASRRHNVRTDASHRFERIVDPRPIHAAAAYAIALIVEVAGGTPCEGALAQGRAEPEPTTVTLRPSRAELILGIDCPAGDIIEAFRALEIDVDQRSDDQLACEIPPHRPDLTREIDLIEEVARTAKQGRGIDAIPILDQLTVNAPRVQDAERAMREVASVLTGLGFYETVTFSFVAPKAASGFLPEGALPVGVDDDRRGSEPTLRPSVIPSLLACRRVNQDAQNNPAGGLRLYETSAVFAQDDKNRSLERRTLTLLLDTPPAPRGKVTADELQLGLRHTRGVIDALIRACFGPDADTEVTPAAPHAAAWDPNAHAAVTVGGVHLARFGLLTSTTRNESGLNHPVVAAEIELDTLLNAFPPMSVVTPLPAFPSIERDLSLVLPETTPWSRVRGVVLDEPVDKLDTLEFVGVYRGKQLGAGKKSLTLRLRFRDPERTLRHEEVDPQVARITERAASALGAEIRA